MIAGTLVSSILGLGVGTVGAGLGAWGLGVLLLGIALLFAFIRLYFMLLQSYVNLLIGVIFAPIFLLGQAMPGQNQFQFGPWLRNIIANLSVFPVTAFLIIIAGYISDAFRTPSWQPPLLSGAVNYSQFFAGVIIPLGMALTIPQLAGIVKKLFGAKSTIPVGAAFSRAISSPMSMAQSGFQTYTQFRLLGKH